jgi:hypothetical protein
MKETILTIVGRARRGTVQVRTLGEPFVKQARLDDPGRQLDTRKNLAAFVDL